MKLLMIIPGPFQCEHIIDHNLMSHQAGHDIAKASEKPGSRIFGRGLFPERNEWHIWHAGWSATSVPTLERVFRVVGQDYQPNVTNLSHHVLPEWSAEYLNRTENI